MVAKKKTWLEKLNEDKTPKQIQMEKDFAGVKAGQRMLVATPQLVAAFIRKIPYGKTRNIVAFRNELAREHQCDASCPVSTSIFIRISAEAALEEIETGKKISEVIPFWRVVEPESKIASKLPVDSKWIAHQRNVEQ